MYICGYDPTFPRLFRGLENPLCGTPGGPSDKSAESLRTAKLVLPAIIKVSPWSLGLDAPTAKDYSEYSPETMAEARRRLSPWVADHFVEILSSSWWTTPEKSTE